MPRVRGNGTQATATSAATAAAATRTPSSYPSSAKKILLNDLNDDRVEKAQRLQSRQALHLRQMSQLKAAAVTPQHKQKSTRTGEDGPETPSQEDDPYGVRGDHVTPMKRVPILANFEEWMKMATDNKINAANSWNFALIDYFHDMSLLKEGDGVNFQKASCTLDGCVKIYTSRVDSVATETGKLLSGLADSGNKKRKGGDVEDEGVGLGEEDEDENEDGTKKKSKKRSQRSAEATLVTSFDQLRLKKMELEFAIDPLFKKASADFDEGGAKGLLLNHLSIDNTGRIVFDSSDDAQDADTEESRQDSMEPEGQEGGVAKEDKPDEDKKRRETAAQDGPVDIAALGARFFPSLSVLDEQDICPTLKSFELGGGDGLVDLPFLKAPENWRDEHAESQPDATDGAPTGIGLNEQTAAFGMDDDDDAEPMGFDLGPDVGFGEGGEAWARDAALQPQLRVYDMSAGGHGTDEAAGEVGVFDIHSDVYGVTLQHRPDHGQENILNYFDNALKKNWAGPEHWKIARIKEANKEGPKRTRKEKEVLEIDFTAPMSEELAQALYTPATNNSSICMPKKEWRSRGRNLLPDDKHFNSKDLLKLFLRPDAHIGVRTPGSGGKQAGQILPNGDVDEAYWAHHDTGPAATLPADEDSIPGGYDANFFQDDGLPMLGGAGLDHDDDDDEPYADAREAFSPNLDGGEAVGGPIGAGIDSVAGSQEPGGGGGSSDAFGANLVAQSRRMRPEYVQYARVAKKVDMRRLKEEMWRGIGFEHSSPPEPKSESGNTAASIPSPTQNDNKNTPSTTVRFTEIMNNLQHVYPKTQMRDISTSYGFICLLHLANEKGLLIENVTDWTDLLVQKDPNVDVLESSD